MAESKAKQPAVKPGRSGGNDSRAEDSNHRGPTIAQEKTKFLLNGLEAIDKRVTPSGGCGRIYLPVRWLGKKVKVIRLD